MFTLFLNLIGVVIGTCILVPFVIFILAWWIGWHFTLILIMIAVVMAVVNLGRKL